MKTISLNPFYKDGYIKQMPKKRALRIEAAEKVLIPKPIKATQQKRVAFSMPNHILSLKISHVDLKKQS